MSLDPSILKRARDLRELAERAGTPGEAQAAAHALAKLIAKHRLEEGVIDAEQASEIAIDPKPLWEGGAMASWRKFLLASLCEHHGVAAFVHTRWIPVTEPNGGRSRYAQRICGRPADCERVRVMYEWLAADALRLGRLHAPRRRGASWRLGFVVGVGDQLEAAAKQARAETTTALVLVDRREEESKAHLKSVHEIAPATSRKISADRAAYIDGKLAGLRHNLGDRLCPPDPNPTPSGSSPSSLPSPD